MSCNEQMSERRGSRETGNSRKRERVEMNALQLEKQMVNRKRKTVNTPMRKVLQSLITRRSHVNFIRRADSAAEKKPPFFLVRCLSHA